MRRDVLERICELRWMGVNLLIIDVVLLFLLVITFPFVRPGSASYFVSLLSAGIILVTLGVFGAVVLKCYRLEQGRSEQ